MFGWTSSTFHWSPTRIAQFLLDFVTECKPQRDDWHFQRHTTHLQRGQPEPASAATDVAGAKVASSFTYRALVQLDSQQLTGYSGGATLALNAGMAVVVEIHQGKRTVMEYLLSPVLKVRAEAARER